MALTGKKLRPLSLILLLGDGGLVGYYPHGTTDSDMCLELSWNVSANPQMYHPWMSGSHKVFASF